MRVIDRAEIQRQIVTSVLRYEKRIACEMKDLILAFGFERMPGEEILLRQLFSSKSEMELQTLPLHIIKENIENWAIENGIRFYYDFHTDSYIFG